MTSAENRQRTLPTPEQLSGDLRFAPITPSNVLAVTTWNAVLESLEAAARAAGETGETSSAGNIAQLRSLCEAADNQAAFLPVSVEELTNREVPQRLIGLADLILELTEKAIARGIADRGSLAATHGWYSAGRYLKIGPAGAWIGIHHQYWLRYGITPLWIRFPNSDWARPTLVL